MVATLSLKTVVLTSPGMLLMSRVLPPNHVAGKYESPSNSPTVWVKGCLAEISGFPSPDTILPARNWSRWYPHSPLRILLFRGSPNGSKAWRESLVGTKTAMGISQYCLSIGLEPMIGYGNSLVLKSGRGGSYIGSTNTFLTSFQYSETSSLLSIMSHAVSPNLSPYAQWARAAMMVAKGANFIFGLAIASRLNKCTASGASMFEIVACPNQVGF
mmetsp:Transcript_7732/g.12137  ORF Transcript_7732/g.12137 Transcript_7732/m.12137 type:complete len:215 (-) Transcript_7732:653-1297(-)